MVPQNIIDFLNDREGYRINVYLDDMQKPTAGIGHLLTPEEVTTYPVGMPVPLQVINAWTAADTANAYAAALAHCTKCGITSPDFICEMTSVCYQLGDAWESKFPRLWNAMLQKNWALAITLCTQEKKWIAETPKRVEDLEAALRALET